MAKAAPTKKRKKPLPSKHSKDQNLVKRLVIERCVKAGHIVWPREMKVMAKLFDRCGDVTFWNSIDLKFELNSVAWFLTPDGKEFLKKQYSLYSLPADALIPVETLKEEVVPANIQEPKAQVNQPEKLQSFRQFMGLWKKTV